MRWKSEAVEDTHIKHLEHSKVGRSAGTYLPNTGWKERFEFEASDFLGPLLPDLLSVFKLRNAALGGEKKEIKLNKRPAACVRICYFQCLNMKVIVSHLFLIHYHPGKTEQTHCINTL